MRQLRSRLVGITVVLVLVVSGSSSTGRSEAMPSPGAGLVVLVDADRTGRLDRIVPGELGMVTGHIPGLDAWRLTPAAGVSGKALAAWLRRVPGVESVEEDAIRRTFSVPNDPRFEEQWALRNTGQSGGDPGADIDAVPAWDVVRGDGRLTVALVDTGVQMDHPDLAGQVVAGRDFVNGDDDPTDDHGHGTAMAGIIAARADNGVGIAGIGFNTRVLAVKALDADGSGTDFTIAQAIVYAAESPAPVINLSFGAPERTELLASAVRYAVRRGKVIVAAAGNDGTSVPNYPAAFPGVLAVSAVDDRGELTTFSNYGSHVDLSAPGREVLTTCSPVQAGCSPADPYRRVSGTSIAAAVVSGVAGLVATQPGGMPGIVAATADDLGREGFDDRYGAGRVNAYRAVGGDPPPPQPQTGDEAEPNDSPEQATALSLGEDRSYTLHPAGDVDWFEVEVPEAGALHVTVTPPTAPRDRWDPAIAIYRDGQVPPLAAAANETGSGEPEVAVAEASPGPYHVLVRNVHGSGPPAEYTIRAELGPVALPTRDEISPEVALRSGPDVEPGSRMVSVAWSGYDDVSLPDRLVYECEVIQLDGPVRRRCPGGPATSAAFGNVPDGVYAFVVEVEDESGNTGSTGTFFLVRGRNEAFGVPSAAVFGELGYRFEDVLPISSAEAATVRVATRLSGVHERPSGMPVRAGSGAVFWLQGDRSGVTARWPIPSGAVFRSWFRWEEVVPVSDTELAAYPVARTEGGASEVLPLREGTLARLPSGAIFLISEGTKRPFPSFQVFSDLGYSTAALLDVRDRDVAAFPTGPAMSDSDRGPGGRPPGTLMKGSGAGVFFLVRDPDDGRLLRCGVVSGGALASRFRPEEIIRVPDIDLHGYDGTCRTDVRPGVLFSRPGSAGVYVAAGTTVPDPRNAKSVFAGDVVARPVPSLTAFRLAGFRGEAILTHGSTMAAGAPYTGPPAHPGGSFVSAGTGVHLLDGPFRLGVSSMRILRSYGNVPVLRGTNEGLHRYVDAGPIGFRDGTLISTPDGRVWVISFRTRRYIPSAAAFTALGYRWDRVVAVPWSEAMRHPIGYPVHRTDVHPDGAVLRTPSGAVYLVHEGRARPFPSLGVFRSHYGIDDLIPVAAEAIGRYPPGPPVTWRPGAILGFPSGVVVVVGTNQPPFGFD